MDLIAFQRKNIVAGQQPSLPVTIVGRIQYFDTTGNMYWTDICYFVAATHTTTGEPSTPITPTCGQHNEMH